MVIDDDIIQFMQYWPLQCRQRQIAIIFRSIKAEAQFSLTSIKQQNNGSTVVVLIRPEIMLSSKVFVTPIPPTFIFFVASMTTHNEYQKVSRAIVWNSMKKMKEVKLPFQEREYFFAVCNFIYFASCVFVWFCFRVSALNVGRFCHSAVIRRAIRLIFFPTVDIQ